MYFVTIIQKDKNGAVSQTIFQHATLNEAESSYHSGLASACLSTELQWYTAIILSETGQSLLQQHLIFNEAV